MCDILKVSKCLATTEDPLSFKLDQSVINQPARTTVSYVEKPCMDCPRKSRPTITVGNPVLSVRPRAPVSTY
jgi:hypothetical protein